MITEDRDKEQYLKRPLTEGMKKHTGVKGFLAKHFFQFILEGSPGQNAISSFVATSTILSSVRAYN